MGRVTQKDFEKSRVRFSRMRDAANFNGWISQFYNNSLTVRFVTQHKLAIGEKFRFEASGKQVGAVFEAVLAEMEAVDVFAEGTAIDGSSALMYSVKELCFQFNLVGNIRYIANTEAPRFSAENSEGSIKGPFGEIPFTLLDISWGGAGIEIDREVKRHTEIHIYLISDKGPLSGRGEVRYCRFNRETGKYRAGIMMTEFSRIDQQKWRRLVESFT